MRKDIYDIKQAEKLCVVDLDGILAEYPKFWIEFVNKKLKTNFKDLNIMKKTVPYDKYRHLKEDYRICGIKEQMPVMKNAAFFMNELKKLKYTIIIATARPVDEYPTLYKQTADWLRKTLIYYDALYPSVKRKYAKILSDFPNIKFVVDDNSYEANLCASWNYKSFLLNTKYNKGIKVHKNVIRIDDITDVLKYVKK